MTELDKDALFEADVAFIKSRNEGETQSQSVRDAIKAYLDALSNPKSLDLGFK